MQFPRSSGEHTVTAQLGPTNTGKTHRAVERMLEHRTGMIGLPLRLLAREIYDRISSRLGESAVALITGEEKRVPARPQYWVCTVEAMPANREVEYLAVDEVQLAGHTERGHVFTDRLLHWRGKKETWFLGADTIRPLLDRLVPIARIDGRPRMSKLSGVGSLSLRALPPRTAVVAFSANRVYELAERLRARRGGAAVVLGALSPRARNAQVALYQSGEVDYMVATDAIGMGLNMDVDCVAFADLRKFDGYQARDLEESELAQIAGRAGRHHNDGRFATLAPLPPLPAGVQRALEDHKFAPMTRVLWRNRDLDLTSVPMLIESLRKKPTVPWLELKADADDARALLRLSEDEDVKARARGAEAVTLLWDVCQIPDYRQLQMDDHFQLLRAAYLQLSTGRGRLDQDWIATHVKRLDDIQGDIDTLLARMAFIRSWTYITHHTSWVDDAAGWQARARAIEDRLSDALHDKLVQRFVDPSSKRSRSHRRGGGSLSEQLRQAVPELMSTSGPAWASGPREAMVDDNRWVDDLVAAAHERFGLDDTGHIAEGPRVLGRLSAGAERLRPEVVVTVDLAAGARLRLQRRLVAWTRDLVNELLAPLRDDSFAGLGPAARGLLYQLEQGMGTVPVDSARAQLRDMEERDRQTLLRAGLRLGRHLIYSPVLLHPAAVRVRVALCQAFIGPEVNLPIPDPEAASLIAQSNIDDDTYAALGFPVLGNLAIRADVLESVATRLASGARDGEVARRLGCSIDDAHAIRRVLPAVRRPARAG